jgi:hypothetical protein
MTKTVEEFIEHYGVKGMRWGVSRKGGKVNVGVAVSPTRPPRAGGSGGSTSSAPSKPRKAKDRTAYQKSPQRLTTDELNKRIRRMETEKRYNELNKRDVSQGEKIATEILVTSAKNIAISTITKVGSAAALLAVGKVIEKKFGKEVATALTAKKKK